MVQAVRKTGTPFQLAYCSSLARPPFFEELQRQCSDNVTFYPASGPERRRFDASSDLPEPAEGTHLYCCGPQRLTESVRVAAAHWPQDHLHFELFQPAFDENFIHEPSDRPASSFRPLASLGSAGVANAATATAPSFTATLSCPPMPGRIV